MSNTAFQSISILSELPEYIAVVLKEGSHDGKRQLYATYKNFKLIVSEASMEVFQPKANRLYPMKPYYTPDGRTVFCYIVVDGDGPQEAMDEALLRAA